MESFASDFADKPEELSSDDIIEQGQIIRCLNGEEFFINCGSEAEEMEAVSSDEFYSYYNLFDTIELLGLPHGKGWINEQEWIITIYRAFKRTYDKTMNFIESKAIKDNGKNSINN